MVEPFDPGILKFPFSSVTVVEEVPLIAIVAPTSGSLVVLFFTLPEMSDDCPKECCIKIKKVKRIHSQVVLNLFIKQSFIIWKYQFQK